ncbi:MAG TPA: hypothetical protein DEP01_08740 [Aminobacterium sp.]|nr:hypothetical protein [Aminobacterium sp.]
MFSVILFIFMNIKGVCVNVVSTRIGPYQSHQKNMAKKIVLGILGTQFDGVAIGILIAKFVLWCWTHNYTAILDFSGVIYIGEHVFTGTQQYFCDYKKSLNGEIIIQGLSDTYKEKLDFFNI